MSRVTNRWVRAIVCLAAIAPAGVLSPLRAAEGAAASSKAAGPVDPPLPPPRPDAAAIRPNAPGAPAAPEAAASPDPPLPPARPAEANPPSSPPAAAPAIPDAAADEACLEELDRLGVGYQRLPAIAEGACGASSPLAISRFPDGLEVTPPATMTCPLAEALARWTRDAVAVEANRQLDTHPIRILIGTSYQCRTRNHQAGAALSEHAFANAVDVAGFAFEAKRTFTIGSYGDETPDARFQAAIRAQACAYFRTVLGPGSDASHATHLHLDLRGRKGGFRLCQ